MALIKIVGSFSHWKRIGSSLNTIEFMKCELYFTLIVKPDFYPPKIYKTKIVGELEITSTLIKIFESKKLVPLRTVLDFIYDIFTKPKSIDFDVKTCTNVNKTLEFKDPRFDEEILAGLFEVLTTNWQKLDNEGKFILEHIKTKKCTFQ